MTDDRDDRWRPLSRRESGDYAAYDALHPGVPSHLRTSLWRWVTSRVPTEDDLLQIERTFRIELLDPQYGHDAGIVQLQDRVFRDEQFFLDVVDFLLSQLDIREQLASSPRYQGSEQPR